MNFIKLKQHYFKRPASLLEEETYMWVSSSKISAMVYHPPLAREEGYTELVIDGQTILVEETIEEIVKLTEKES